MDIKDIVFGKTIFVGIGNIMRRDDGLGPALIAMIHGHIPHMCIDAGTTPENHTRALIKEKPDTIIFIDAVSMGRSPGQYAVLEKDQILMTGFSTHDLSANMLIEYLSAQTNARFFMIGVQPESTAFGPEISTPVKQTLNALASRIKEAVHA
ncbi:MAG: hydrogenase maturation protease [Elusimicrobia bacterium]|nr:hydrogenase maturation protease [Elusimicrobiota bacterium]MBD3411583.1 hydrogenase maturation protease [Elusimicrobiota bacterium]